MNEARSITPLLIGLLLSVTCHLTTVVGYSVWRAEEAPDAPTKPEVEKPKPPAEPEPKPKPVEPEPLADEPLPPPPKPRVREGQLDPSPIQINWISAEAFEELQAHHAPFDQAAVQKDVDPVPDQSAPLDPTPMMPTPSSAASSPVAQSQPARPAVAIAALVQPTETPARPEQAAEPMPTQVEKPLQAPRFAGNPAAQAAAPMQGETTPPGRIEESDPDAPAPRAAIDGTPADDPLSAPLADGARAERVALSTPPLPSNASPSPMLPESVTAAPLDASGVAARRAPDVAPDDKSNPDDKTLEQLGDEANERRVAMLDLAERVRELIGSPQLAEVFGPAPDRVTAIPPRPRGERDADGEKPVESPREMRVPAPARPNPADTKPRPTSAPKERSEATPVTRQEHPVVRPGKLVVQQGLKVMPAKPRLPLQASLTRPKNVNVSITFNHKGEVVKASLLGSTGYQNLDSPILNCLYKWKAEGEGLPKTEGGLLTREYTFLLWGEEK